jgi:hypothetical protein
MADEDVPADRRVLVISVWHESPGAEGFRARVVCGSEDHPAEHSAVTDHPEDVLVKVQEWLAKSEV